MSDGKIATGIRYGLHAVEKRIDATKRTVKRRLNWIDPVDIVPYRGFGNGTRWILQGRVTEQLGVREPSPEAPWYQNARAMIRRFTSDEMPFVRLRAEHGQRSWEAKTDDEGYFEFELKPDSFDPGKPWHDVQLTLLDQIVKGQDEVTAVGRVSVPAEDADFGVISDIDDTVLKSHATDLFRLIRLTLFNNSRTRGVLPGVPAFYRALQEGASGDEHNPFFYVSSSAWNLYDAMVDFFDYHELPAGPILLRDLGLDRTKFIKTGHEHKLEKIRRILETCQSIPFLLIGDAGQRDPQLYGQVVEEFPDRILSIYIRDVSWKDRTESVRQIAERVASKASGVDMLLVPDTTAAAQHAADRGWLDPQRLDEIERACEE